MRTSQSSLTETPEATGKRPFRFSLKWKWTLSTAGAVLVIFTVITLLIFNSFMTVLLQQERTHVGDTLNVVVEKLNSQKRELTGQTVASLLRPQSVPIANKQTKTHTAPYSNAVVTSLARDSQTVTIYDKAGNLLFNSRETPVTPFHRVYQQRIVTQQTKRGTGLIGRSPIRAKQGNQIIGYVQVVDNLQDYHETQERLLQVVIVLGLMAALAAAVLSYILASFLLRPMDAIRDTIHAVRDDPQTDQRVPVSKRNDELGDLTKLLNDMIDTTQRYIDQQQQFVEDVSHELRTPVAIIQGHMEMLDRWGKDDPEVLNESIQVSLQETKRMKSLVQEMLDLQRAEQIEVTFTNEVTDVTEVVTQVYDNFKMIHPDFVFILDDDVHQSIQAQIYRNHLEQILIILLDNAVKYSTTRKEVHLTYERDSRNVEIAVQDFGEGISQTNRDRVFNRFYRVDKARSRTKGGNGLGLAIAKRLIEGYHGSITIESAVGHGSVFRISLPILSDQTAKRLTEKKELVQAANNDVPGIIHSNLMEDDSGEDPTPKDQPEDSPK
ncbi:HAMP domain-containing sensor histidine kinase [Levilactobacillus spicheri]|uniref:Signal transduction histidine-protein kinase ArlS n=1 Tax=Levilactobacillus spicheri DSM 15429 TaxID=1423805 RepID=A0A0R1QZ54_9LACO|nr:HAMP domain-containing histidine kinase [Levilactobacillus spicheri]KRL46424.1 Signal transduction histidine kinase [Levilactobacillus spicheri DSM 15429]